MLHDNDNPKTNPVPVYPMNCDPVFRDKILSSYTEEREPITRELPDFDITTPEQFERIVDERLAHCRKVLLEKNKEYSRNGDRLHNFRSAARRMGTDPMNALLGMKVKHEVSIEDMVQDCLEGMPPTKKQIAEKFGDDHNYLLLLEALILEYIK